jgi:zinc and cadmium transporter
MNYPSLYAILSVIAVSLISFIGLLTIFTRINYKGRWLYFMISFAAGALLGDVFIHLLPELAADGDFKFSTSLFVMAAIVILFTVEKYVHWHHHADEEDEHRHHAQPFVFTNLIGDGIHNLIDGMVITGAYLLDVRLGVATTVAVFLHEIPQEFADFGVLVYGGLSVRKALFYNFLSALTALIGSVLVLTFGTAVNDLNWLVALGAGSFIYLATADLIPEIHKAKGKSFPQFLAMLLGISVMFALLLLN